MEDGRQVSGRSTLSAVRGDRPEEAARSRRWGRYLTVLTVLVVVVAWFAIVVGGERIGRSLGQLALDRTNARLTQGQVVADDIRVRWNVPEWRVELELGTVRYEIPPQGILASADSVAVGVSLEGLSDWRISGNRVAVAGLSAIVDAAGSGGPFLVDGNSGSGMPLAALLGPVQMSGPGEMPRIEVSDARLELRTEANRTSWNFDALDIESGVIEDGRVLQLSAVLADGGSAEDSWIELQAEWSASEPAVAAVTFESLAVYDLAAAASPSPPHPALAGLVASGTAHFALDFETSAWTAEGGITIDPGRIENSETEPTLSSAAFLFRHDSLEQHTTLSRIALEAGAVTAHGELELQFGEGEVRSASGGFEIGLHGERGTDARIPDELDGTVEFAYFPAHARVEVPQFWLRTESSEATGSLVIAEFDVDERRISGMVDGSDSTLSISLQALGDPGGILPEHRSLVLSDISGDAQVDLNSGVLSTNQATVIVQGSRITIEDLSFPLLGMADPVSGRLRVGPVAPERIAALWPPEAAPEAHAWFEANAREGEMSTEIHLFGTRAEPTVEASFEFEEAAFVPSDGLPLIQAAVGQGHLDSEGFHVFVERAYVQNSGGRLALTHGYFGIPDLAGDPLRAVLEAEGEGPASVALDIAKRYSVSPLGGEEGSVAATAGRIALSGQASLLLQADGKLQDWRIVAEARGLDLEASAAGLLVRDADVGAEFGRGEVSARGTAEINGIRTSLEAALQADEASPTREFTVEIVGSLEVPEALHDSMAGELLSYRIEARTLAEGGFWKAELDVAPAEIRIGETLLKSRGAPGFIEATGSINGQRVAVSRIAARLPEIVLAGDPLLADEGWDLPLTGDVEVGTLERLGFPLLGAGKMPLFVDLSRRSGEPIEVSMRIGLETAVVDAGGFGLNALGIRNEPGPGAYISAAGSVDDGRFALQEFRGAYGGLVIDGKSSAVSKDSTLRSWHADLRIANTSRFVLKVQELGGSRYKGELIGDVLDISGTRSRGTEGGSRDIDATGDAGGVEIEMKIGVRRLQVTEDMWLEDASGRIIVLDDGSLNGSLRGLAFGSVMGEVLISQVPDSEVRYTVALDDAGGVLNAIGITSKAEGGRLQITSLPAENPTSPSYAVQASGVRVGNVPLVGKLISFISGIGLIEYVLTGNLTLDSIVVNVTEDGDVLRLTEGSVESASVAIVFAGDYDPATDNVDIYGYGTPLRFVSRALGELPIIGHVVRGPDGKGIIGVGFTIKGPSENPEVVGSPLDLLFPLLPQLRFQSNTSEAERAATE